MRLFPTFSSKLGWRIRQLTATLLLAHATTSVWAAEIYLKDGSIVIGTIETLTDGEDLTVDTVFMDHVVIEWDAIERIEGAAPVNIELFSGERLTGNLSRSGERLSIRSAETKREHAVEHGQVFEINKYTNRWYDGLEADLSLGFNIVRGNNTVTQISYGGGLAYEGNRFEAGLDTSLIVNEQTDAPSTRRFSLQSHYTQELSGRWTAGGIYQYESDDRQQLAGRSLLAGLLNNRLINNRRQRLSIGAGLALNSEDFDTTSRAESIEAIIGATYRLRSSRDIDLDAALYVLPSLSESDRLRAQFDATLSADLFGDLDVRIVYYNRYDSAPPSALDEIDYGVTLALGYEF